MVLREFFKSIFSEWGSALCGIASIPLTAGALYESSSTQKAAYACLAGLLGFYSAYRVFAKERERSLTAESKLDDQVPKISITIDGAAWSYDTYKRVTKVWLCVTIGNGGGPSIVKGWNAQYLLEGPRSLCKSLSLQTKGTRSAQEITT